MRAGDFAEHWGEIVLGDRGEAVASRLHKRGRATIAALAGLMVLSGCDGGVSEAQLSYDACVDAYNNTFRSLPGDKAIVSGVTGSSYQCFWIWSAASIEAAQSAALANCQEKQERCFVFATNAGLTAWAAQISANGGVDRGVGGGSGVASGDGGNGGGSDGGLSLGDVLGVTNAILGGVASGLGNGGGGAGGHMGGGGARSSGANSAQCQQYLNLAQQCRQRQATMNSVGSNGLGTSGQAGSFNDCYNLYMNAYNASCR